MAQPAYAIYTALIELLPPEAASISIPWRTRHEWVLMPGNQATLVLGGDPVWVLFHRFQRSTTHTAVWKGTVRPNAESLFTAVSTAVNNAERETRVLGPVTLQVSGDEVYRYASDPRNLKTPYDILDRVERVSHRYGFDRKAK